MTDSGSNSQTGEKFSKSYITGLGHHRVIYDVKYRQ
jgi:hypothetical protein